MHYLCIYLFIHLPTFYLFYLFNNAFNRFLTECYNFNIIFHEHSLVPSSFHLSEYTALHLFRVLLQMNHGPIVWVQSLSVLQWNFLSNQFYNADTTVDKNALNASLIINLN